LNATMAQNQTFWIKARLRSDPHIDNSHGG
jgi:hypothetical protein